jgi:TetR/AcrR family transcriptional regulator, repressor of fatR-cypB operon
MNVHSIKAATNRTVRGRPRTDDKRRLILDAALRVFAERGYHGTAVPEVAQAAKVSTGTLYHYFESKELLVNEVYRDAKTRLRSTLLDELPRLDPYQLDQGKAWFTALWNRLGAFAQAEPDAFRFLEMQDHTPYLDNQSKQLELSVLAPLWLEGKRLTDRAAGTGDAPPVDVAIALLWGAFVGLIKASRLGYLTLDERSLARAGAACWRMIAPQLPRAATDHGAKTGADEAVERTEGTRGSKPVAVERPSRARTVDRIAREEKTIGEHAAAARSGRGSQPVVAEQRGTARGSKPTAVEHDPTRGSKLAAGEPPAGTSTVDRLADRSARGSRNAARIADRSSRSRTKVPRSPRTRKG